MKKIFITGGAGFIGSNLVRHFLGLNYQVTVYDNLSNGKEINILCFLKNDNFVFIKGDISDSILLNESIKGFDLVIHLASNADIAKAQKSPLIDFEQGVSLTVSVLEAMRNNNIKKLIFTSGSGVYGEVPDFPIPENFSPLYPVSTYGAQKLSSENYISAYSFMFDMSCVAFRFANVVGPKQTHGVTHDFVLRLRKNPNELEILGDGTQTKPFIHVDDIFNAFVTVINKLNFSKPFFDVFNVSSTDQLSINEIAQMIFHIMEIKNIKCSYTGGNRGWKADVPKYSLDTTKIRKLGWKNKFNSREAVMKTIESMLLEINEGVYD
jgi:UDP-glucose 4-epimerase